MPPSTGQPLAPRAIPVPLSLRAIPILVAVSGASALAVEVVLGRMLYRVLGSTSLAVASVVAGFLGGMGIGAFLAERILPRIRSPLVAYGAAELASLCAALLFASASGVWRTLLGVPGGEAIIVSGVMLLAMPWGAAFPLILTALPRDGRLPARVRAVYGWNAVGGAAGALLGGLLAVPRLGEWGTLLVAAAAQAAVAAWAVALGRSSRLDGASRGRGAPPGPAAPGPDLAAVPPSRPAGFVTAVFLFLSGFLVLYWEVLWTRILVLTVGSTVYSFSVIAGAVVLGIGAGTLLLGGAFITRHGGWFLSLLAAVVIAAGYFCVPFLPDAYLAGVRTFRASPLAWGAVGAGAVAFVPNFLLGSLFPWAISRRVRLAGTYYAVNSAGAVLGAFAGGPMTARLVGLEGAYRAGALGLFALALLGGLLAPGSRKHPGCPDRPDCPGRAVLPFRALRTIGALRALGAIAMVIAGVFIARDRSIFVSWDTKRLLSGVYQWSRLDLENLPLEQSLASRDLLCVVPGREVIVTVELERDSNTVYVRGNGKVEGSVPADPTKPSLADLPTQALLGELPAELFHAARDRTALLIGLGSGVSLGALVGGGASFPEEAVDVIEIEEAFRDALLHGAARPYLEPFVPARVLASALHFHFGDARRLLGTELRTKRWDAIVSQPSEPWIPGAAPLFTVELFEEAAGHLKPGGVFFQWLQIYKLDGEAIRLVARTFRRVFPQVFILRPPGTGEVILLGSFEPIALERFLDAPAGPLLGAAGLEVPADRLAVFLLGPRGVDGLVGLSPALPVNTDARGELEILAVRSLYSDRETARENLKRLQALGAEDPISRYLPDRLRADRSFLRLLASRNIRLGDFGEALADLEGDASEEARLLRNEARREGEDSQEAEVPSDPGDPK